MEQGKRNVHSAKPAYREVIIANHQVSKRTRISNDPLLPENLDTHRNEHPTRTMTHIIETIVCVILEVLKTTKY